VWLREVQGGEQPAVFVRERVVAVGVRPYARVQVHGAVLVAELEGGLGVASSHAATSPMFGIVADSATTRGSQSRRSRETTTSRTLPRFSESSR